MGWGILKYFLLSFFSSDKRLKKFKEVKGPPPLPDKMVHHCLLNITELHCQPLSFLFVRNIILYCIHLPFPVSQSQACKSITIQIVWKIISEWTNAMQGRLFVYEELSPLYKVWSVFYFYHHNCTVIQSLYFKIKF